MNKWPSFNLAWLLVIHGTDTQWPVDAIGPANRRKQQCCPDRAVFDLMVTATLINKIQRKRLLVGRNA